MEKEIANINPLSIKVKVQTLVRDKVENAILVIHKTVCWLSNWTGFFSST